MAVGSAAAVACLVCGTISVSSAAPAPNNPSDSQLSAAQQAKNKLAARVGQLSALLLQAQAKLQALSSQAELAQQKYALAVQKLEDAKQTAAAAQAANVKAQQRVDAARQALQSFVRDSYISPTMTTGAGGLLTAKDPNALLERGDYLRYVSDRHLDVLSQMDQANVAKSNADAAAKAAVLLRQSLSAQAQQALADALAAKQAQQAQQQQLQAQQASYQKQFDTAQLELKTLQGERATYLAYQRRQAEIAAAAAERLRQAQLEQARRLAALQASGGSSGGGAGDVANVTNPPPAAGGTWTAAKGRAAVARAMKALGMPYAWAGGNAYGPTFGVNSPGTDGWNDSTVFGFDCSGLVMYAWASQGLYLAHYAATQYSQAGSYHPSPSDFRPGDLLFWGTPSQGDIHHVAIYIGGGNVIQAPNSGSVVQITPWDQVSPYDYFGATRPLT